MHERKLFPELVAHLSARQITVITGMRRVGKTTALQLARFGELNYYQRMSGQEIDFVLNRSQAVEVKETPSEIDLHTLKSRAATLSLEVSMLVGRTPPASGFTDFVWGGSIL